MPPPLTEAQRSAVEAHLATNPPPVVVDLSLADGLDRPVFVNGRRVVAVCPLPGCDRLILKPARGPTAKFCSDRCRDIARYQARQARLAADA